MLLIVISLFAGVLTILTPCVLPILPIILASGVESGGSKNITRKGPYIIILSLAFSILVFSLLLKASTLLIDIPSSFWAYFSGSIIILLGIATIFPTIWLKISKLIGLEKSSHNLIQQSNNKKGVFKNIFLGIALGPVFSSCSPTYGVVIASVLPQDFIFGLISLLAYIVGLSIMLLLIAIFGQRFSQKLKAFADPKSKLKIGLGIVFVLVGVAIFTGYDKVVETRLLNLPVFQNLVEFESGLLDNLDI